MHSPAWPPVPLNVSWPGERLTSQSTEVPSHIPEGWNVHRPRQAAIHKGIWHPGAHTVLLTELTVLSSACHSYSENHPEHLTDLSGRN